MPVFSKSSSLCDVGGVGGCMLCTRHKTAERSSVLQGPE